MKTAKGCARFAAFVNFREFRDPRFSAHDRELLQRQIDATDAQTAE